MPKHIFTATIETDDPAEILHSLREIIRCLYEEGAISASAESKDDDNNTVGTFEFNITGFADGENALTLH